MIRDGDIKVEDILASTTSRDMLKPRAFDNTTGKETHDHFSHDKWGAATKGYVKSIKKRDEEFIEITVNMAREISQESASEGSDLDDERAMLCTPSSSFLGWY